MTWARWIITTGSTGIVDAVSSSKITTITSIWTPTITILGWRACSPTWSFMAFFISGNTCVSTWFSDTAYWMSVIWHIFHLRWLWFLKWGSVLNSVKFDVSWVFRVDSNKQKMWVGCSKKIRMPKHSCKVKETFLICHERMLEARHGPLEVLSWRSRNL